MASNDEQEKKQLLQEKWRHIQDVVESHYFGGRSIPQIIADVAFLFQELVDLDSDALGGMKPEEAARNYVYNQAASRYHDLREREIKAGKKETESGKFVNELIGQFKTPAKDAERIVDAFHEIRRKKELEKIALWAPGKDEELKEFNARPSYYPEGAYIPSVGRLDNYEKWDARYASSPKPTSRPAPATNGATASEAGAALAAPPDALSVNAGLDLTSEAGAALEISPEAGTESGVALPSDARAETKEKEDESDEIAKAISDFRKKARAAFKEGKNRVDVENLLAQDARKIGDSAGFFDFTGELEKALGYVLAREARSKSTPSDFHKQAIDRGFTWGQAADRVHDAAMDEWMNPGVYDVDDPLVEAGNESTLKMPSGDDVPKDEQKIRAEFDEKIQAMRDFFVDGDEALGMSQEDFSQKWDDFTEAINNLLGTLGWASESAQKWNEEYRKIVDDWNARVEKMAAENAKIGEPETAPRVEPAQGGNANAKYASVSYDQAVSKAFNDPEWLRKHKTNEDRVTSILQTTDGWDSSDRPGVYAALFRRYRADLKKRRPNAPPVDAWGYGEVDWDNPRLYPAYDEFEIRRPNGRLDIQNEKTRVKSQSFIEMILEGRRGASNRYVKDVAKERGFNPQSIHANLDDVRNAMNLNDANPTAQMFYDAYYRIKDYLSLSDGEIAARGLFANPATAGDASVSEFEKAFPLSSFNLEKRDAKREYKKAKKAFNKIDKIKEAGESYDQGEYDAKYDELLEAQKRYETYRQGFRPAAQPGPSKIRKAAQAALNEITSKFDVASGTVRDAAPFSASTFKFLSARGTSGIDAAARAVAGAGKGVAAQGVNSFGELLTMKGLSKAGGALASSMFGGAAAGLAGPFAVAVGVAVAVFKKLNAVAAETVETFKKFANINGRIATATAQYEGAKFMRDVRTAENTSKIGAMAISAQNRSEEEWQPLKEIWLEFKGAFAVVWYELLRDIANAINNLKKLWDASFGKLFSKFAQWGSSALKALDGFKKDHPTLGKVINAAFGGLWRAFVDEDDDKGKSSSPEADTKKYRQDLANEKAKAAEGAKHDADAVESRVVASGEIAREFLSGRGLNMSKVAGSTFFEELGLQTGDDETNRKKLETYLRDPKNRDKIEDYIATYDQRSSSSNFKHYRDLGQGENADGRYLQKILHTLDASHAVEMQQQRVLEESLRKSAEIAANTAKSDNPLLTASLYEAMLRVANKYAVKPGLRVEHSNFSSQWGQAGSEPLYGRFARDPRRTGQIPAKAVPTIPGEGGSSEGANNEPPLGLESWGK